MLLKPNIFLIDVDGVVADLCTEWLRWYNIDYNDNLTLEDLIDWSIHQFTKAECGTKIYDYLTHQALYDNVRPIDGAFSAVKWLRRNNQKVVYVTSGVQPAKIQWLHRYGFLEGGTDWMYAADVVIAHDKSLIKGAYLIDDNIQNCQNFEGTAFLFDQPWNRKDTGLYRVRDWPEIIEWVGKR
jgi:5'(3')-deoxyribonucleotidase